jgi:hypothetical protein
MPVSTADYAFFDKPPAAAGKDCRVCCDTCRHIVRDRINPPAGIAECSHRDQMHYPMARHFCADYQKRATP